MSCISGKWIRSVLSFAAIDEVVVWAVAFSVVCNIFSA